MAAKKGIDTTNKQVRNGQRKGSIQQTGRYETAAKGIDTINRQVR
jgi:hypothetical protein